MVVVLQQPVVTIKAKPLVPYWMNFEVDELLYGGPNSARLATAKGVN